MTLSQAVERIKTEFEVSNQYLDEFADFFVTEATKGLEKDSDRGIPMLPTFVTSIPDGSERGLFLAADLGGSNFRVCSVQLNGDSTHTVKQMKWPVPKDVMRGTAAAFWKYLADCTLEFLCREHPKHACADGKNVDEKLKMGFTFSFPVHQTALDRGNLIRWTKGYNIKDAVGTDVCLSFQRALDDCQLPIHVAALVNDTVGCLLARSYETGSSSQTLVGSILGTGTNAAYSEKIKYIKKLDNYGPHATIKKDAKVMIVNTEWGSFDNDMKMLPKTTIDEAINRDTPNPDFHMFEKRVSGMFLGEITRRILERSVKALELFNEKANTIPDNADLYTAWSMDTGFLSVIAADETENLDVVNQELIKIGIERSNYNERFVVKEICHIVALRSARLVAGIIAGLLKMTKAFDKFNVVDIGMDGAVIEFYPRYEEMIREALRDISFIGQKEKRITIGISKDGSGIGAALCAAKAE